MSVYNLGTQKLRKIQQTRTGTYFVCLIRSWAEKHGVKKGTQVTLTETTDGRLCINAGSTIQREPRVAVLTPSPLLSREIVGRYLLGFDIIRIQAKERFDFDVRETAKQTLGSLIGLEIVEETSSEMVLQCLLDPFGLSPEKLLVRNYTIVSGMCRDAVATLVDGDLSFAKSVIARDGESDRQYFLLVRLLRAIVQDAFLGEKLGLSAIDCMDYRLAASYLESLGDAAMQIAGETIKLNGTKPSEELKGLLLNLMNVDCEAGAEALKAFIGKDLGFAEHVKVNQSQMKTESAKIELAVKNQQSETAQSIQNASSCLNRIYELSCDLADLVV